MTSIAMDAMIRTAFVERDTIPCFLTTLRSLVPRFTYALKVSLEKVLSR